MRKPTYDVLETEKVSVDKNMPKKIKAVVKVQGTGAYIRVPADWVGRTVELTLS